MRIQTYAHTAPSTDRKNDESVWVCTVLQFLDGNPQSYDKIRRHRLETFSYLCIYVHIDTFLYRTTIYIRYDIHTRNALHEHQQPAAAPNRTDDDNVLPVQLRTRTPKRTRIRTF